MNLFDDLQRGAFGVVTHTMGYAASWAPSAGGAVKTATVLFKDASQTARLLQIEYDPKRAIIEYFDDQLTGLKTAVNLKRDEEIIVNGIAYGVNEIKADADGKTLIAHLELL